MTGAAWQRFGAVDVHYQPHGGACAALVVASDERFSRITAEHTARVDTVAAYLPGQFYLRELPALQAVLATTAPMDLLVIDGYVTLDPHGRPGLGAHLHTDTGVKVIGVAKTAFATASQAIAVRRGAATRPLYVTAAGLRSSSREESHLPALADLGVTISRHPALVILSARACGPMPSGRKAWGTGW